MVTFAGKELLKNTINTVNFHNKIQEEREAWRQWEMEQGLTMMVSDDLLKNKKKNHLYQHHAKLRKKMAEKKREIEKAKIRKIAMVAKPKSKAETLDRWDHGGYEELYPKKSDDEYQPKSANLKTSKSDMGKSKHMKRSRSQHGTKKRKKGRSDVDRWDHNGFRELYPDKSRRKSSSSSSSLSSSSSSCSDHRHRSKKRWDHKGFRKLYPGKSTRKSSSSSSSLSSSSSSCSDHRHRSKKRSRSCCSNSSCSSATSSSSFSSSPSSSSDYSQRRRFDGKKSSLTCSSYKRFSSIDTSHKSHSRRSRKTSCNC